MEDGQIQLTGTVETIIYQNEENGYTVLSLVSPGSETTVVGSLPMVCVGEEISVSGHYADHKTYGPQFVAESYEKKLPVTSAAILKYLSGGAVKGIGRVTATRIVELFGDDTLTVIDERPQELTRIRGISPAKAESISESFKSQFGIRALIIFLQQYEINLQLATRVWKKWGFAAVDKIKSNPYLLSEEISGISFDKAVEVADNMGFIDAHNYKIAAALLYILVQNSLSGHTFVPKSNLVSICADLVDREIDDVTQTLNEKIAQGKLINAQIGKVDAVFLAGYYMQESRCAAKIVSMVRSILPEPVPEIVVDKIEKSLSISFNAKQRRAILQASQGGIMVLTGGPGTGKTTVVSGIIKLYEMQKKNFALIAPTGRAAKRISELSGYEAKTVHRLLEMQFSTDGVPVFGKSSSNPLDYDAIICDESSMMDITLMDNLLQALPSKTSLVLVGDNDQLPPVGPGNPFGNIIQTGIIPTVALDEIFRQAADSYIVTNAHRILKNEQLIFNSKNSDFYFINTTTGQNCLDTVVDLCIRRLPNTYGWNPNTDIQVITPSKLGALGTAGLNKALRNAINPQKNDDDSFQSSFRKFCAGDKVMQVKNNYDIVYESDRGEVGNGVYNGDIGIVKSIDKRAEMMYIQYDDRRASYPLSQADDLDFAYAITAHKSQGSEFECVVLVLYDTPKTLLYRNLLYTAITRAKKLLVIVGNAERIEDMLSNTAKGSRFSGLKYLIIDANGDIQ